MPRLREIALPAALIVLCCAVPAAADGQPVGVSAHGPGWHGESPAVAIAGSGGDDEVEVRSAGPSALVVSNAGGVVIAAQTCQYSGVLVPPDSCGCRSVDALSATCYTTGGIQASGQLLDGDDTIRVFDPIASAFFAGRGADRVVGNALGDFLRGGPGSDRLAGRHGNDEVYGLRGHDSSYGGAGNDLLWAVDDDHDRVIDCGSGNDRAFVDRKLDPKPIGCEHVHFS
jgi:Ca2+-binding RTX toxin-like protein